MLSVGATKFWMSGHPAVEPLRLRRAPLLAVVICFALGEIVARRWQPPLLLVFATAALLGLAVFGLQKALRVALLPAMALWCAAGCWCAQMQPPAPQQVALQRFADGLSRTVRGRVVRVRTLPAALPNPEAPQHPQQTWLMDNAAWETDETPPSQSLDLEVTAVEALTPELSTMQPVAGGLRLALLGGALPLRCGDVVELPVRLRTPDTLRNPGAWSYAEQLRGEGVGVTGSARSSLLRRAGSGNGGWHCRLYAAQAWAAGRLGAFVDSRANRLLPAPLRLTAEDAAMLSAMLFGDRSLLSHGLRNAFERTGTFHLFVVSGLHVALLAAALFWLLRHARLPEGPAVVLTIAAAAGYSLLTGFGVPAQRALLMTAIVLVARWLDREAPALNVLAAAALGVLALDPRALFEASFQMTFLVIFAVTGLGAPLSERLIRPHARALEKLEIIRMDAFLHPRLAQFRVRLRMACALSAALLGGRLRNLPVWLLWLGLRCAEALLYGVAAELCMVVPMAVYFHRATLLALPINLVDIPLLCLLLCAAVLMFLGSLFNAWVALPAAALTSLLLHAMRSTVDLVSHAALADVRTPAPAAAALLLAAALLAWACIALRSRRRLTLAGGVLAALAVPLPVLCPAPPRLHPGLLEVTALDVGQGDSLLVVSPSGATMLVDAGGPVGRTNLAPAEGWDVGEQVVAPYLWSRRIRHLDAVLLTHAHSDHMGGMPAVLRDFHPRELWLSVEPGNSPGLRELLAEAESLHIAVRHLRAGDAFTWSGLHASVLAPERGYANPGAPVNDDSLVLRLEFQRASALLEGDAEAPSEAAMLANHRVRHATLLKVGHHGSKTSTNPAFLAAVSPQDAVISVGRHNTFGHPRAEVLGRLEAAHVRTFRTDRGGAETFLLGPDGGISAASAASD